MAWYYGTYSCGHEGRINLIGPSKTREWKKEREFSGLCPECNEKRFEEEKEKNNKEALEKTKELELPELIGSEKQVSWANTLRLNMLEKIEVEIQKLYESKSFLRQLITYDLIGKDEVEVLLSVAKSITLFIIENKTSARYYIENRDKSGTSTIINIFREIMKERDIIPEEIIQDGTIAPEEVKHSGIVKVLKANSESIEVEYQKDNDFIRIVKELNYKWNGLVWHRNIKEVTGSYVDRAAELGNKLLNEGFTVCILDEEIRKNAIEGTYEHECKRWILTHGDKLKIKWYKKNDELYNASRRITKSRWIEGGSVIPVENYEEVEEFAEMFEFKFSKAAKELIERYIEELNEIPIVTPQHVEEIEPKDGLIEILNSSRDILDDLKEED